MLAHEPRLTAGRDASAPRSAHAGLTALSWLWVDFANLGLPTTAPITNQFDNVARLTNTVLMNSGGTALGSRGYSVNAAGQRRSEVRTTGSFVVP